MTSGALQGYAEAKARLAGSLREMTSLLDESSPLEAALSHVASAAIEQLAAPTPGHTLPPWESFRLRVPGVTSSYYQRPVIPDGCYDASFGRVHVRPGCRC